MGRRLFGDHIRETWGAEPAYITMNMPILPDALEREGIERPITCSNINKIGFRMSDGFGASLAGNIHGTRDLVHRHVGSTV